MSPDGSSGLVSSRVLGAAATLTPLVRFFSDSPYARRAAEPGICDFCFGNPQEMPLPQVTDALARWVVPQSKDWYAYQHSVPSAVEAVVASLRQRHGIDFQPEDVAMTTGAFGALASALHALVETGDEVVYLSPPWFLYEAMVIGAGGTPVRVDLEAPRFDLPLDRIQAALTPATRAVIVNSPHNPSGRIYQPAELERLGAMLEAASARAGRPVYLLSDEAYSRILFDGAAFTTPLHHYHRAILIYTYGKTLLTPGQRLGYIALPPTMPGREEVRAAIYAAQHVIGWTYPNAVMQYALPDLEQASIDVAALQRRRDRVVDSLSAMGYECIRPEATFYVLVRSPIADDVEYVRLLGEAGVLVMPGEVFQLPGWFRISLTANDDMVERALPVFERTLQAVAAPAG